jgi:acyl dehydratase
MLAANPGFDTIRVGDEIPARSYQVTLEQNMAVGNLIGDNRTGHVREEVAETQFGVPVMANYGIQTDAFLCDYIVDWLGDVKPYYFGGKQFIKLTKLIGPGDTITFKGKIADKTVSNDVGKITCQVEVNNQNAELTALGTVELQFSINQ